MSLFPDKFIRLLIFAVAVACNALFVFAAIVSVTPNGPQTPIPVIVTQSLADVFPITDRTPILFADSIKYPDKDRPRVMVTVTRLASLPLPDRIGNWRQADFDSLYIYVRSGTKVYQGVRAARHKLIQPDTLFIIMQDKEVAPVASIATPSLVKLSTGIGDYEVMVIETSICDTLRMDRSCSCLCQQHENSSMAVCESGCKALENARQLFWMGSSEKLYLSYVEIISALVGQSDANHREAKQDSFVLERLMPRVMDSTSSTRTFLRDAYDTAYDAIAKKDGKLVIDAIRDYALRYFRGEEQYSLGSVRDRLSDAVLRTFDVDTAYHNEMDRLRKPPPRKSFGDIVEFILALFGAGGIGSLMLYVLRKPLRRLVESLYEIVAGWRIFNWIAKQRYLRSLERKYGLVKIPYGRDRFFSMRDIYVPLKGEGYAGWESVDIFQELKRHKRIMITGKPGAGKSTLLNRIAFDLVQTETEPVLSNCIPVVIELHRVKRDDGSLKPHLEEAFKRSSFPKAKHFIARSLKKGRLMLLLDGLDEVNPRDYDFVVDEIQDLLQTYDHCRAVVTCRTQVYLDKFQDEFRQLPERHLEIAPFSDKDIYRFLSKWEREIPKDKSINSLIDLLDNYPEIRRLASNPLLLTIMTCLYADTPFALPHSRSEFYKKSTTWLLGEYKPRYDRYSGSAKHMILRQLALHILDASVDRGEGLRTVEREKAFAIVRQAVRDVGLEEADVSPILDEIVRRSGLLLKLDGGLRYQFVHLSLQEYFAACALEQDVDGLLQRFTANPKGWREVVKLWCGEEHDSSEVIRRIFDVDLKTAFECVADATKVEDILADRIVGRLQQELWKDKERGPIVLAFGSVAADAKPRGRKVFELLRATLIASDSNVRRSRAAFALAATKHRKAVEVLAAEYTRLEEARRALESMGNLAVNELERAAAHGSLFAVDSLATIGTPLTLQAMVRILYTSATEVAERAAWRLANMLQDIEVQKQLERFRLDLRQLAMDKLDWVWEPYGDAKAASLSHIVGRISYLVKNTEEDRLPEFDLPIDVRIAVPLALEENLKDLKSELGSPKFVISEEGKIREDAAEGNTLLSHIIHAARTRLRGLLSDLAKPRPEREQTDEALSKELHKIKTISDRLRKYVSGFSSGELVDFIGLLLAGKDVPKRSDWGALGHHLARYRYDAKRALSEILLRGRRLGQSMGYLLVLSFFGLMSLASFVQLPVALMALENQVYIPPIGYIGWVIAVAVIAGGWLVLFFNKEHISIRYPAHFFNYGMKGMFHVPQEYIFDNAASSGDDFRLLLARACFMVWLPALVFNSWTLMWNRLQTSFIGIGILFLFVIPALWEVLGLPPVFEEDAAPFTGSVPLLSIWYRFIA